MLRSKARRTALATSIICIASIEGFTCPVGSANRFISKSRISAKNDLFFADEETEKKPASDRKGVQLFSEETLQEANDALSSVGWSGVAPASASLNIAEDQMGELTSDDPFVKVSYCNMCGLFSVANAPFHNIIATQ